ncbi:hypothetical protein SeMB42_g04764 [Synchytrium endobioticum]|uniref:Uncharacterized protein n=1 Tax=Synchytrium endobioticum TaxID=286115 RepID=A0A507CVZ7_9FUNG|nr:hypothetical protein SeMB42_g04764 [Synchytrium endobioticum]
MTAPPPVGEPERDPSQQSHHNDQGTGEFSSSAFWNSFSNNGDYQVLREIVSENGYERDVLSRFVDFEHPIQIACRKNLSILRHVASSRIRLLKKVVGDSHT